MIQLSRSKSSNTRLKSILKIGEDRISEMEDTAEEFMQSAIERGKNMENVKKWLKEMTFRGNSFNIHLTGVPGEENGRRFI